MTDSPTSAAPVSLRIIVADDEEYIRQFFARMLPRLGHQVVGCACSGRELVEMCLAEKPDLIITDIRMPEMSGIDAANEIAKSHAVPVVIVSSHEKPDVDNVNIVAFLVKPFALEELAVVLAKVSSR